MASNSTGPTAPSSPRPTRPSTHHLVPGHRKCRTEQRAARGHGVRPVSTLAGWSEASGRHGASRQGSLASYWRELTTSLVGWSAMMAWCSASVSSRPPSTRPSRGWWTEDSGQPSGRLGYSDMWLRSPTSDGGSGFSGRHATAASSCPGVTTSRQVSSMTIRSGIPGHCMSSWPTLGPRSRSPALSAAPARPSVRHSNGCPSSFSTPELSPFSIRHWRIQAYARPCLP